MGCQNDKNKKRDINGLNVGSKKRGVVASKDIEAKICLLGDVSVGKTSIASRFCSEIFSESYVNTIGGAYQQKIVQMDDGSKVKLHIWDTSGQDRFRAMTSLYYRDAQAAILVYDVGNNESFEGLEYWIKELCDKANKNEMILYMAGNKCDIPFEKRKVAEEKARMFAEQQGLIFYETSAKTGEGIKSLFHRIARDMYEKSKKTEGGL